MTTRRNFVHQLALGAPALASLSIANSSEAQTVPSGLPGTQGVLFGIDTGGNLRWLLDESRAGVAKWHPNSGALIGTGWGSFRQIVAGEDGAIFALSNDGTLRWYQYTGNHGESRWHPNSGAVIGVGWSPITIVYGGRGILYAIDNSTQHMRWYRYLGQGGSYAWDPKSGSTIGVGWSPHRIAGNGQGTFYYVDTDNTLRWYKDIDRKGGSAWAPGSGGAIGVGWSFDQLVGAREGILYGLGVDGYLRWYRHTAESADQTAWASPSTGPVIRSGVQLSKLTASYTQLDYGLLGYTNPEQSVVAGGSLPLYLSSSAATYSVEVFRLGIGNSIPGLAGTKLPAPTLVGAPARLCVIPQESWQYGCGWPLSTSLSIPANWASGAYAARCTDSNGSQCWIPFAVRPPQERTRSKFALLLNTNTWAAYNTWGGRSNYTNPPGVILSTQRPNPGARPVDSLTTRVPIAQPSSSYSLETRLVGETWVHRWLLESGFSFDVYSDMDLHEGRLNLSEYRALILASHPEYWSVLMYQKLKDFLVLAGRGLYYLGGNGIYESVDYSSDRQAIVLRLGNAASQRESGLFSVIGLPQQKLLGVSYRSDNFRTFAPYKVLKPSHRFFNGTGVVSGSLLGPVGLNGAASGHELDASDAQSPPSLEILARGTNIQGGNTFAAEMVTYRAPGGGTVFSAGSLSFAGSLVVDATLTKIVRNALSEV